MSGEASRENGKKGGRPQGSVSEKTLEKQRQEREMQDMIRKSARSLVGKQMVLASGVTFLWRIDTDTDKSGKVVRQRPVKVTDPEEIEQWIQDQLDGEQSNEDAYYFVSTERPDNRAIDSMLDRAFGKARQSVEVSTPGGEGDFNNNLTPEKAAIIAANVTKTFIEATKEK